MNIKSALATAAGLLAACATTGTALAANAGGTASDQNLRYTRAYVERAYNMLSHDQSNYGGHRAAAMDDIAQARTDLAAALKFDSNPDDATIPTAARSQDTDLVTWERGQQASNENIAFTRHYIERAIDMLQHDAHDYGGFREKAIDALNRARAQLLEAIQFRDAHPGEPRSVASDENLRFSRLYLERAVDMLSHDRHDYGGHRAAAIADINVARGDLSAALKLDANHEDAVLPDHAMSGDADLDKFYLRGQFASNENVEFTRRYVERAIDMLQHDAHDYGGLREKAIDALHNARQQLLLAIQYR